MGTLSCDHLMEKEVKTELEGDSLQGCRLDLHVWTYTPSPVRSHAQHAYLGLLWGPGLVDTVRDWRVYF